jgi:hypothetical protein
MSVNLPDYTDDIDEYGMLHVNHESIASLFFKMAKAFSSENRQLGIGDGHVWLSFEPAYVKVGMTDSGALGFEQRGFVVVQGVSEDGQTMTVKEREILNLTEFRERTDVAWLTILSKAEPYFVAAMRGEPINTLINRDVLVSGNILNADVRNWSPRKTPEKKTLSAYEKADGITNNGALQVLLDRVLLNKEDSGAIKNLTLHVSRFTNQKVYEKMGLGEYFKKNESGIIAEFDKVISSATGAAFNAVSIHHRQQMKCPGILAPDSPLMDKDHRFHHAYTEPLINFIATAPTEDVAKYRAQFIDQCLVMMSGDDVNNEKLDPSFGAKIASLVVGKMAAGHYNKSISSSIDEGSFPAKYIAQRLDLPNLTKSQFRRGMRIYGDFEHGTNGLFVGTSMPLYSLKIPQQTPQVAFTLAKIPMQWFVWDEKVGDIYTKEAIHALVAQGGHYAFDDSNEMLSRIMPFLKNTGKALDRLNGVASSADSTDDQKNQAKKSIKQIATQWSWLSSNKTPLPERLSAIDNKYKIKSSYGDYGRLLDDFLQAVIMRTLYDNDVDFSESFVFDANAMKLEIDKESVQGAYLNFKDEDFDETPYFDDDIDEYVYPEFESASEYIEPLDIPGGVDVIQEINVKEIDFRVSAKLNNELHKMHGEFIKEANKGADFDFNWQGLFDEPLDMGEFTLHGIDSRVDLLSEAVSMDHCVFSYLNACLAGESVILSARNNLTDERIATIELVTDEGEGGECKLELTQCYGHGNTENDATKTVRAEVEKLVISINRGDAVSNLNKIVHERELVDDVVDMVECDPKENGSIVCSIPYTSDGAYLAYYAFNRFTPSSVNIEHVMQGNEALSDIYHHSTFRKDILLIEALANTHQMSPVDIVRYKTKHAITDISRLEVNLAQRKQDNTVITSIFEEYAGVLEVGQIVAKCQSALSKKGRFIPDTVLFDQDGKLTSNIDSIVDGVQTAPKVSSVRMIEHNDEQTSPVLRAGY